MEPIMKKSGNRKIGAGTILRGYGMNKYAKKNINKYIRRKIK